LEGRVTPSSAMMACTESWMCRRGVYTVTATQTGFNTARREDIEITTAFTATVNFSLMPGSVSQTVTVSGEALILDTQDTLVQNIVANTVIASHSQ
jgi:hypothetical protein